MIVAVIMYEMVPRSNCEILSARGLQRGSTTTCIDTGGQSFAREFHLKIELVNSGIQTSLAAQRHLIPKERHMPVAEVLRLLAIPRRGEPGIRGKGLICVIRLLEDAHESMETDCEVRNSDGLDNGKDDGPLHDIAGRVPPVRLIRTDVKVGQVARTSPQRQRQPG